MGFWSGTKKVVSFAVNLRVDKWLGIENLKNSLDYTKESVKHLVKIEKPATKEEFHEAMSRLNINPEDLQRRAYEFKKLFTIYAVLGLIMFCYSLVTGIMSKNFFTFTMGLSLSIFLFTKAFKFHFWLFQIKNKKLGCSVQEWLGS